VRAASLLLLLALPACAVERTRTATSVADRGVTLEVDEGGPWREVAVAAPAPRTAAPPLAAAPKPAPVPVRPPPVAEGPTAPSLPVPQRRGPEAPANAPPNERYVAYPTVVRAERITFRCPKRLEAYVTRAEGRVTCRELTLESPKVVVNVEPEGVDLLGIAARGDACFVTVQNGQVLREEHAKAILVSNDRVTPLR
jgi:hypothetical protein